MVDWPFECLTWKLNPEQWSEMSYTLQLSYKFQILLFGRFVQGVVKDIVVMVIQQLSVSWLLPVSFPPGI